jgi:hypothetical protein
VCAIREGIQVKQDGLKLNGTHQLLVYVDGNVLGGSVNAMQEKQKLWYWLVGRLDWK